MKLLLEVLLVLIVGRVSILMFLNAVRDARRRARRPSHLWSEEERAVFRVKRDGGRVLYIMAITLLLFGSGHWLIQMMFQ